MEKTSIVPALRRELEEAIIRVNYHYQSGYERHVNLQKPESILLNFLKKKVTLISPQYLMRLRSRDFYLSMSEDMCVINLMFTDLHWSHYHEMCDVIKLLEDARQPLEYEELRERSKTLDKFYQQTCKIINSIHDFKFT